MGDAQAQLFPFDIVTADNRVPFDNRAPPADWPQAAQKSSIFTSDTAAAFVESTRGSTCALLHHRGWVYVMDSHHNDTTTGLPAPDGRAVLLKFSSLAAYLRYLRFYAAHVFTNGGWGMIELTKATPW